MANDKSSATKKVEDAKEFSPKDFEALVTEKGSRSAAIRHLNADGMKTADIVKVSGMSYQEVRGLLSRPLRGETPEQVQERINRGKKVTDNRGNYGSQDQEVEPEKE